MQTCFYSLLFQPQFKSMKTKLHLMMIMGHTDSTNRGHMREMHINGFQRPLKPSKAMKQTVGCAKHQAGLSACFTDTLGNSRYSTTTEQATKLALACHKAMKWLWKAESVKRKQSFRNVSESKHTCLCRSSKRKEAEVLLHSTYSGWRVFYPQTGHKMKCTLHNWNHINHYQCFSI